MEKIQYKNNDQVTAQMRAGDFWRLRPVRSKTGVHIQIIQKRGMPFFFSQIKKEKLFCRNASWMCSDEFFYDGGESGIFI